MNFSITTDDAKVYLSDAILIYKKVGRGKYHQSGEEAVYATLHDVSDVGTPTKPNVQIMAGTPLTQNSLIDLMGSISDKYTDNVELLPENVLSFSPRHLIWWMPSNNKSVFFMNKELGTRSANTPTPALLFIISAGKWYIFALKDNVRPNKDTILHHAPYFNVYDSGLICVGTASIPTTLSTTTIPEWECAFFNSEFTHANGNIRKVSYPDGEYSFWKKMLDGDYKTFPNELLVEANLTLGKAMASILNSRNK